MQKIQEYRGPLEFLRTDELDQLELMDELFEGMENKLLGKKPDDISDEKFKKSAINKWNIFYDTWFQQKLPVVFHLSPMKKFQGLLSLLENI